MSIEDQVKIYLGDQVQNSARLTTLARLSPDSPGSPESPESPESSGSPESPGSSYSPGSPESGDNPYSPFPRLTTLVRLSGSPRGKERSITKECMPRLDQVSYIKIRMKDHLCNSQTSRCTKSIMINDDIICRHHTLNGIFEHCCRH